MSNHKLREDNICQNCHYTVDRAYCSNCGQKNTETRQSFLYLITHFAEDFTHYDGAFWKTMKHLLFWPAKLTKEYLSGKRQTYVPPVKLYIFISFVTFFIMSIFFPKNLAGVTLDEKGKSTDSIQKSPVSLKTSADDYVYKSVRELDSLEQLKPEHEKLDQVSYWMKKIEVNHNEHKYSLGDYAEVFIKAMPKTLFVYMPIFAFWLWLFHGKKKWYFFDHGIFTLHYFSFLLLLATINVCVFWLTDFLNDNIGGFITSVITTASNLYAIFYFFRSHRRFYGENRLVSRLKSVALFIINFVLIFMVLMISVIYAFAQMH